MKATINDINELSLMVKFLWPEHSIDNLKRILKEYVNGDESAIFTYVLDDKFVGVALVCLRHDYVEGCITSPVGYLEGIYVDTKYRNSGIAKKLCEECEEWARDKGCSEFGSDCDISNDASYKFHLAVGFNEEDRIIHFKKIIK